MTTGKKAESTPPLPDVREQTERIRAASRESTEQIAESRRLSKDSRKRMAASLPKLETDPPIKE